MQGRRSHRVQVRTPPTTQTPPLPQTTRRIMSDSKLIYVEGADSVPHIRQAEQDTHHLLYWADAEVIIVFNDDVPEEQVKKRAQQIIDGGQLIDLVILSGHLSGVLKDL